jgi:hypothetical protein
MVSYLPFANNSALQFYSSNFTGIISATNPSLPNPVQGQTFANCPFVSALASIAWVNRKFIRNNISGPDGNGDYTFTFWDYGVNNTITLPNTTPGTPTPVTVGPSALLDSSNQCCNASGFYGQGSAYINEIWPALYERAYAKFCMYENGLALQATPTAPMSETNLTNTACDPALGDVVALSHNSVGNYWGGNGAYALMYLTGLPCVNLSTQTSNFPTTMYGGVAGNVGSTANSALQSSQAGIDSANGSPDTVMCSLYEYIKAGLCNEYGILYGVNKTRYPCVATTYASASLSPIYNSNPNAVNYGNTTIIPNHNYPVLGVFDAPNGLHYFILRTTFGSNVNFPNPTFGSIATGTWTYYDAQFPLGTTTQYPATSSKKTMITINSNLSSATPNAVFGLEQGAFVNYFSSIGWAQGY